MSSLFLKDLKQLHMYIYTCILLWGNVISVVKTVEGLQYEISIPF